MRLRRCSGSQIAEFAPTILIVFMLGFFPILDLIGLGAAYMSCWWLNNIQTTVARENLAITSADGKTVTTSNLTTTVIPLMNQATTSFASSALANLAHAQTAQITSQDITIAPPANAAWAVGAGSVQGTTFLVTVTTNITSKPFIPIPFIPGMGTANKLTISRTEIVENAMVTGS